MRLGPVVTSLRGGTLPEPTPGVRGELHRLAWAICLACGASAARAEELESLPNPLPLQYVVQRASERRAEVAASRARAQAAAQRPAIVSALEDPMISPSIDHLPFMLDGVNASLAIEQRFPLSRVLTHRGDSARAEAARWAADSKRVELNVEYDAASAFFMLQERRGMAAVLVEQRGLAGQMVRSATARYASGTGAQADVLRAEMELARLEAFARAAIADVRGAEAMLNAALARPATLLVPPLVANPLTAAPAEVAEAIRAAIDARPELRAGRAEIDRAEAETRAMRSMYLPMATVRTGPAYTMTEKFGWMLMIGVSIPLWRGRLNAGVSEAESMATMAREDVFAMQRMIEGEAAKAREDVISAQERYLAFRDKVVPKAKQAADASLAGYVSGQLPLVSVVEAAQALWMAQGDQIMAEAELGLAWARLGRALGASGTGR